MYVLLDIMFWPGGVGVPVSPYVAEDVTIVHRASCIVQRKTERFIDYKVKDKHMLASYGMSPPLYRTKVQNNFYYVRLTFFYIRLDLGASQKQARAN